MNAVKISPKFQVVIPRSIRKALHLRPGQTLQVVQYGHRIEYVPIGDMDKLRGFAKGINTQINREEDRI